MENISHRDFNCSAWQCSLLRGVAWTYWSVPGKGVNMSGAVVNMQGAILFSVALTALHGRGGGSLFADEGIELQKVPKLAWSGSLYQWP